MQSMLLDNKKNGNVGDTLRKHLITGSRLSVISSIFSIYGFESLKNELQKTDGLRLLLCLLTAVENCGCGGRKSR